MDMHINRLSATTAANIDNYPSFGGASGENAQQLINENRLLMKEMYRQQQQTEKLKREMLCLYQQNLFLKKQIHSDKQSVLVAEFQGEIRKLRETVDELQQKSYSRASEREELKDRIIMKLEDELIAAKIEAKEAKYHNVLPTKPHQY